MFWARFGELTIIVLGGFFLKAALGAAERESCVLTICYSVGLLGVSVGLWWLYFDHLDHSTLTASKARPRFWVDLHHPFLAAVAAYGVAGTKVLAWRRARRWPARNGCYCALRWPWPCWPAPGWSGPQIWVRFLVAAVLAALALWGGSLSAPLPVALLAGVFAALVAVDLYARVNEPLVAHAAASSE